MATLVLTAVGSAVGGPVGAAIGAILGSQIDKAVIGAVTPKNNGPQLKDLSVQTSSYGTQIPATFGAMRVAGSVVWASDLLATNATSGGDKGGTASTTNSYSVHLAVALSCKPLLRVGRIWADGNLLRGAAGDFKVATGFRFYQGHGDQPLDPLIAAAEGPGTCPAFRDVAYAVFENLNLAEYGNRIPSLTFEIFEREDSVAVSDLVSELSDGLIAGTSAEMLSGYAASGSSAKAALAPLFDNLPIATRASGKIVEAFDISANATLLAPAIATYHNNKRLPSVQRSSARSPSLSSPVSLRYFDPARDYQPGVQSSRGDLGTGQAQVVEFAASLSSAAASRLASNISRTQSSGRQSLSGHFSDNAAMIEAGDLVNIAGVSGNWRIKEIEHFSGHKRFLATPEHALSGQPDSSDPGRNQSALDLLHGPTRIVAFELPAMGVVDPGKPVVAIAACGTSAGWRSAALSAMVGSAEYDIGRIASPAVIGQTVNALPPHSPHLIDARNRLVVDLAHSGLLLPLSPVSALVWAGGEILSYANAEQTGAARYELSDLRRGLFGTGNKVQGHVAGEDFVLLEPDNLMLLENDSLLALQNFQIFAQGIGDETPVATPITIAGLATLPRAPVHGRGQVDQQGTLRLSWIRLPRLDLGWRDGIEQPVIEETERYSITCESDSGNLEVWQVSQTDFALSAAEWSTLLSAAGPNGRFSVRQVGKFGVSPALLIPFASII